MAVTDYSTTAGNNSTISGVNIAEGCSPAGINNAIRQMMADVRAFYDATPLIAGTPTVSGNWTVSGAWTITGNMTFNDSVRAIFGTGADLQIYHNGGNSFIEDTGTGALSIKGSLVQITGTSNEVLVRCSAGGAAELLHNGSTTLTTSTTGVTVTGLVGGDTIGGAMVSTDVSADTGSTTKVPHVAAVETAIAAALASYAQFSTSSTRDELSFPVGQVVAAVGGISGDRRATATIYLSTTTSDYSGNVSGTALSGTWRLLGRVATGNYLAQRVA